MLAYHSTLVSINYVTSAGKSLWLVSSVQLGVKVNSNHIPRDSRQISSGSNHYDCLFIDYYVCFYLDSRTMETALECDLRNDPKL